ncbi:alcohol dehydrogenase catalytic domain-containing protein [Sphingomonas sp. MMS24-JH45]
MEQLPEGSAFEVGQTVAINPYLACGTCMACRHGKANAYTRIRVLGRAYRRRMCERLVVPESALVDATGLTVDQAAMVEFLAIGAHAVARAGTTWDDARLRRRRRPDRRGNGAVHAHRRYSR